MKSFKLEKETNWKKYIVGILVFGLLARGAGYVAGNFLGTQSSKVDEKRVLEQDIEELSKGCLEGSKNADITQNQKIAYCSCIASGFIDLYPERSTLIERSNATDLNANEEQLATSCLAKHVDT